MSVRPSFRLERALAGLGYRVIAGVDEAGCGALAGPVVAGAAVLPLGARITGVRDSKQLSSAAREDLYGRITAAATAWAVGIATVEEIAALGIRPANLLAMRRAVEAIPSADYAIVDAWTIPGIAVPQRGIVRGDQSVRSVAAASILAKVTRDRIMVELAAAFPDYGFEVHKGYATKSHLRAIELHGPCSAHRLGFKTFGGELS